VPEVIDTKTVPNKIAKIAAIVDRKYHLAEIISPDTMKQFGSMFFSVVGINVIFVDNRGVPISPPLGSFPSWCQSYFNENRTFRECLRCFEKGLINSFCSGSSQVYQGHCGQTLISAPLYANNNVLLGCLITGPVQIDEDSPFHQKVHEKHLKFINSIPRISSDRFTAIAELISTLANYLTVSESLSRYQQEVVSYQQRLLEQAQKASILEEEVTNYQLLLKEAQLRELQAKMNPHFLFNALNTIARLAFTEKAPETERAAFALADIARYGIEGHLKTVPLRTELKHINSYLHIQRIRFGSRVNVKVKVPQEHQLAKILPYTVQPLVENAFNHGLESAPGKRNMVIYTDEDPERNVLFINVEDDGIGIDSRKHTRGEWCYSPDTTIGNIHQRVKELYGAEFGLQLKGPPEFEGTRATLVVPLI